MIRLDYELAIINCAIGYQGVMAKLASLVRDEYFLNASYQKIWKVLSDRYSDGLPIDPIIIAQDTYLTPLQVAELTDMIADPVHHRYYALKLQENYFLKSVKEFGGDIQNENDFEQAVIRFNNQQEEMNKKLVVEDVVSSRLQLKTLLDSIESGEGNQKLVTGWKDFDKIIIGLRPGNILVVAGRTGMGKTDFMVNLIERYAIRQKKKAGVFTLEMTNGEILRRLISIETSFSKSEVNRLGQEDIGKLIMQSKEIANADLEFSDNAGLSPGILKSKIEQMRGKMDGIDIVLIDYIQLMQPNESTKNRTQDIGQISRSLKQMAKEFKVPFVVVSQLNRMAEARSNNRPKLSDIRESGDIEHDADAVILLYRDSYYNKENQSNICEIIIAKNRSGETTTINMDYDPSKGIFSDSKSTYTSSFKTPF